VFTVFAFAQATQPAPGGGMAGLLPSLIFLLVFIAIFYFMLIWPQRRKQRQHRELIASLKRGDEVITSGGLVGKIKKVDKDTIILEVEEGVNLRVLKESVIERLS